jgi:hypothetical protein
MKTYGGVEIQLHPFSTSALDGGEWSASRPCRFTQDELAPGTHWIGGWLGPRTGLEAMEKKEITWPCQESNHDSKIIIFWDIV